MQIGRVRAKFRLKTVKMGPVQEGEGGASSSSSSAACFREVRVELRQLRRTKGHWTNYNLSHTNA